MLEQIEAYLLYLQAERAASPHTLKNYTIDLQQFRTFLRVSGLPQLEPAVSTVERPVARDTGRGDALRREIKPAEIDTLAIRAFVADLQ